LDESHAPKNAPDPADDDDEGGQLEQRDDDVDCERSSLGLDPRRRAAAEHAESRHQRSCKQVTPSSGSTSDDVIVLYV